MAIEYTLELESVFRRHELEKALAAVGLERHEDDDTVWLSRGLTAFVTGAMDRFGRYKEGLGLSPLIKLYFTIDKFNDYFAGMKAMVKVVAAVLAAIPDDVVLMENHDTALLLRRDGVVTLTDRDDWWKATLMPPAVSLIPSPYRFATLPII